MSAAQRLEDWLVPRSLKGDWRAPFFIRVWAYGLGFGLVFGLFAATQGLWWLFAAQGYLFTCGVVWLLLLRATGKFELVTNLSLGSTAPFLAFAGLLQNPANPITPVFLLMVPLLAGFVLSRRATWGWLVISMLLGGFSEWLMSNGYHVEGPLRAHHGVVTALNLAALMLLVLSFVRWFDGMRRDTLERLEAASRARTIFLANVSHEIRTPMNGVLGLTELVLAGALEPAQREKVELVQRSGQSLVTLIDDLLLITRAESGRLVITPGPASVTKVVADVAELFESVARQKGLHLEVRVGPEVPTTVELDGVRWRQVLTNLVSNAVKFTPTGVVRVSLSVERSARLVLAVQDEGEGIAPEVLARLFRPFEQADASTTRRFGGSGLGLALSKQLVELMGGRLTVDSVVGKGSVFRVDLPLVEAKLERPARAAPPLAPGPRKPVLVVDDNPINLVVARGLVERAGYEVHVAKNGVEAVAAVAMQDFGVVFMDCQMPEMDGLEATRRIRASSEHPLTIIVALTASGLPEELDACRQAGMNDCLVKPVSFAMVERALALAR
jgi:signal transduction histidine kinase/CheY-like chemotaxis protein